MRLSLGMPTISVLRFQPWIIRSPDVFVSLSSSFSTNKDLVIATGGMKSGALLLDPLFSLTRLCSLLVPVIPTIIPTTIPSGTMCLFLMPRSNPLPQSVLSPRPTPTSNHSQRSTLNLPHHNGIHQELGLSEVTAIDSLRHL